MVRVRMSILYIADAGRIKREWRARHFSSVEERGFECLLFIDDFGVFFAPYTSILLIVDGMNVYNTQISSCSLGTSFSP